ncbi:MAG: peptide deformylase [Candidatus Nitrosocaldus sp.]
MKLLLYPDSRLTSTNGIIDEITDDVHNRIRDMFNIMYTSHGIGLAAPQVGWNVKLFIINITGNKNDEMVFINPTVKPIGNMIPMIEGCLSFPGIYAEIKRPIDCEVVAKTLHGEIHETYTGLLSRAIQHEYDHIESILFIERFTPAQQRQHLLALHKLRYRMRN